MNKFIYVSIKHTNKTSIEMMINGFTEKLAWNRALSIVSSSLILLFTFSFYLVLIYEKLQSAMNTNFYLHHHYSAFLRSFPLVPFFFISKVFVKSLNLVFALVSKCLRLLFTKIWKLERRLHCNIVCAWEKMFIQPIMIVLNFPRLCYCNVSTC